MKAASEKRENLTRIQTTCMEPLSGIAGDVFHGENSALTPTIPHRLAITNIHSNTFRLDMLIGPVIFFLEVA